MAGNAQIAVFAVLLGMSLQGEAIDGEENRNDLRYGTAMVFGHWKARTLQVIAIPSTNRLAISYRCRL
jgi:hypothetical protein